MENKTENVLLGAFTFLIVNIKLSVLIFSMYSVIPFTFLIVNIKHIH